MTRKSIYVLSTALLLASSFVEAQQVNRFARVGYLDNTFAASATYTKAFRERLRELGYIEAQNITIEPKYWEGNVETLPKLAADLVRLKCDVIVTAGTEAGNAARNATQTIPIVLAFGVDVLRLGFVADIAHPGGNITGLTSIGVDINGKRLELLKEVVPKLSLVAFLWTPTSPSADNNLRATETLARSLGLRIQPLEVKEPDDFGRVFKAATKNHADALLLGTGGFFAFHQKRIIELSVTSRLPAMHSNARFVEEGGLMTYAYDRPYQFRRAAEYVDRILKGAKPADLPIERPKKFELVINLKTAKQIGLAIPPQVLARADKVIK